MAINLKRFSVEGAEKVLAEDDNPFDRQERISWWRQSTVSNAKVMVVGAGAIGNEVLKNLALLGVGHIFIVDLDHITASNLSRTVLFRRDDVRKDKAATAASRVRELHLHETPKISHYSGDVVWDIGTGIYRQMDIVMGCLDNIETRIRVNRSCRLAGVPWIDAGIRELGARVVLYRPDHEVCYECNLDESARTAARERYSCDQFKKRQFDQGKVPTVQVASALVAALQTQEAMKLLCGQDVVAAQTMYFQGMTNTFFTYRQQSRADCNGHVSIPEIRNLPIDRRATLADFLNMIEGDQSSQDEIVLDVSADFDYVVTAPCRKCYTPVQIMQPSFRVFDDEVICKATCSDLDPDRPIIPDAKEILTKFSLNRTDPKILQLTLEQIGFPLGHIATVIVGDRDHYYQVDDDIRTLLAGFPDLR
ncbi:MAG: ThiF family adenylyltransferase [Microgenomates group bacterium]